MTTTYCDKCGAYIPSTSDVCLSCGKPKRFYSESEGDYLVFHGEKIPIYVGNVETQILESTDCRGLCDEMPRYIIKYIRKFVVIEKHPCEDMTKEVNYQRRNKNK